MTSRACRPASRWISHDSRIPARRTTNCVLQITRLAQVDVTTFVVIIKRPIGILTLVSLVRFLFDFMQKAGHGGQYGYIHSDVSGNHRHLKYVYGGNPTSPLPTYKCTSKTVPDIIDLLVRDYSRCKFEGDAKLI